MYVNSCPTLVNVAWQNADSILDSNGPIFMPNTRLMQQMLKFDFERYQEEVADGKCAMDPSVVCIQKGIIASDPLMQWE
jgi:hypothetical protein